MSRPILLRLAEHAVEATNELQALMTESPEGKSFRLSDHDSARYGRAHRTNTVRHLTTATITMVPATSSSRP